MGEVSDEQSTFANVKFRAVQLMIQWANKCITSPALSSIKDTLSLLMKERTYIQYPSGTVVIVEPHLISASRVSKRTAQETDWKKCEEELQIALALTLRAEQKKPKPLKVRHPLPVHVLQTLMAGNETEAQAPNHSHM